MDNNITILKNNEFTIFRNAFLLKIKEYVELEKNLIYKPLRVLILHHNDLDGIFPMVIAKHLNSLYSFIKIDDVSIAASDTDKFIQALNNNDEETKNKMNFNSDLYNNDNILECYDAIFIVDLSVREEKTFKIINNLLEYTHIVLLDHHQYPELNQFNWAWVNVSNDDNIVCGTSLFYEYVKPLFNHNELLDKYVNLVSDWDTFNWKKTNNIDALNLNKVFGVLTNDDFVNMMYSYLFENMDDSQFKIYINIYDNMLNDTYYGYINSAEFYSIFNKDNDRIDISIGFCPQKFASLVSDAVYSDEINKNKDTIIVLIDIVSKKISFRTNSDKINLKKIAEEGFNGGGHAKASGGSLENFDKQISIMVSNIKNTIKSTSEF